MTKARMIVAAVLFLFVPIACAADGPEAGNIATVISDNGEHTFTVELALDDASRAQGLMYRTELAPDRGMLFMFNDSAPRSFWMRNTYIPLDIIFIRYDGRILNIVRQARPRTDTPRQSIGSAIAVLEIAGGRAAELGIRPGDTVRHPLIDAWKPE